MIKGEDIIKKKTIIELCMSPDLGGLELYMAKASEALKNDFHVITVTNENAKIANHIRESQDSKIIKKSSNFFMFLAANKLAKIVDDFNVELIHIHWTKDIPFVVLAKLLSKSKPKIIQSRHMTMTRYKDDFYHNFLYKNINTILAVTNQVRKQIIEFIPSSVRPKLKLLYPGADKKEVTSEIQLEELRERLGMDKESFKIGMVGRINEDKGQYLLIKAVELLLSKGFNVDAYFVGNTMKESYLQMLKKEVQTKGLEKKIHFLGFLKSPSSFYQLCDTIVLASKKETFGLVLVEAMLLQKTVIGANSGGVLEIIDDKENGLLFESQDYKSLADSIELLINNEDLSLKLAKNAKIKSEKLFNNNIQFQKLSNIIQEELECLSV